MIQHKHLRQKLMGEKGGRVSSIRVQKEVCILAYHACSLTGRHGRLSIAVFWARQPGRDSTAFNLGGEMNVLSMGMSVSE